MPTMYIRRFNLKDSMSNTQVLEWWQWVMGEVLPVIDKFPGTRSVKAYSGAGGLTADIVLAWEMDDAGVYERAIASPELRPSVKDL